MDYLLDVLLLPGHGGTGSPDHASCGKEVSNLERTNGRPCRPRLRQAVTDRPSQAAPPPRSVEEVKAMLESTEKGGVRNSIRNCLTVFQHDPLNFPGRSRKIS